MSDDDRGGFGPIIAMAVVLLLALLGLYIGGYVGLSKYDSGRSRRAFESRSQVELFWPALWIEKRCRGRWSISWPINSQDVMVYSIG
jgi:hypothetical protein